MYYYYLLQNRDLIIALHESYSPEPLKTVPVEVNIKQVAILT